MGGGMPPGGPAGHGPGRGLLAWSVLAAVLCPPVGAFAVLFTVRAGRADRAGDAVGARTAVRRARLLALWSTVFGVATVVLSGVLLLASVLLLSWLRSGSGGG